MSIWKSVKGFESTYEVSHDGKVRSITRVVAARLGKRLIIGRVLKQKTTKAGYKSVQLCDGKRIKNAHVHRLVAEAFFTKNGFLVRHLDGDPSNNNLGNLVWGSHVENEADKLRHGRLVVGDTHHNAKLTCELVKQIRSSDKTDLQLSLELGVARWAIYSARRRLTWKHVE